jgi:MFS family permease
MIALSGLFSVTFSVVFAYVADLTTGPRRSSAYGQVSATFAASLIISPALGAHLGKVYGDNMVILLATVVAALDVLFILFVMPESLPEKLRSPQVSMWEQAAPLSTMRKIGRDFMIWTLCLTVFLSYLPEAGQYSCFFVYLKLIVGFSEESVAKFIAFIGLLSVLAQTVLMTYLIDRYGGKATILAGLLMQAAQLLLLGFFQQPWMMWICGIIASFSSMTYPAISAYISSYADDDKQGLVQGLITGVRSLCGGIGPAMFGVLFYIFDIDMYEEIRANPMNPHTAQDILKPFITPDLQTKPTVIDTQHQHSISHIPQPIGIASSHMHAGGSWIVGPPFLFGSILVILAAIAATFIPDTIMPYRRSPSNRSTTPSTSYYRYTTVAAGGNFENGSVPTVIDPGAETGMETPSCELLEDLDD